MRAVRSSVVRCGLAVAALAALSTAGAGTLAAQAAPPAKGTKSDAPKAKKADNDTTPKVPKAPDSPLFKSESVIDATLTANFKAVKKDKSETAPWHAATIAYADSDAPGGKRVVPLRVRTRGIWRLKNCDFPPLRFNFANKEVKG
ncbi:MAG: hypothetical protein KA154_12695, partial [Gemmatimonadaceae bacterium]|nr:hypothetical protein [Gemmatimonadaceae bacterium]